MDKAETFIGKSIYCLVKSPVLCVEFKQNLGLPELKVMRFWHIVKLQRLVLGLWTVCQLRDMQFYGYHTKQVFNEPSTALNKTVTGF